MKVKTLLTCIIAMALLSSCAVTLPGTATNNAIGSKKGTSETVALFSGLGSKAGTFSPSFATASYLPVVFLGIPFNGDFGVLDAAKNGKITKIATVDIKYTNYFLFSKIAYIVTGE